MTVQDRYERRRQIIRAFSDAGPERWKHFAPDLRWRMIGTTAASGVMIGVEGVDRIMSPFLERFEGDMIVEVVEYLDTTLIERVVTGAASTT